MRRLREALKPDGRLVLLEFRKEDRNLLIVEVHTMSVAEVKTELEPEGYQPPLLVANCSHSSFLLDRVARRRYNSSPTRNLVSVAPPPSGLGAFGKGGTYVRRFVPACILIGALFASRPAAAQPTPAPSTPEMSSMSIVAFDPDTVPVPRKRQ